MQLIRLLSYEKKGCCNQTINIFPNHKNHQSSSKTFQTPETNQITNINTLTVPTLLYGSETWTLKEINKARITAAVMKCLRKTAKYVLYGHNYKNKWIEHVSRMDRSRLPKAIMKYQPPRKRNPERPLR
jgi:hypothetical protein